MIKQGFYDLIIIFGFRLESEELEDVSLFELYQNTKSQIKIYLSKNYNRKYELYVEDEKNMNSSMVFIQPRKTYIFVFQFLLKKAKQLKINYIKDDDGANSKEGVNSGHQIKLKSIKLDNLKICIGCKREKESNTFKPNFSGYIGDLIILNAKHIKEEKDLEIFKDILKLKGDYIEIAKILSNNNSMQNDNYYNMEYNSTLKESRQILVSLENKTEFKSNFMINTIISPKYFKLVEYHDDIDYLNNSLNDEHYIQKISKPLSLKYKYFTGKTKSEPNYKKCITINSSLYNRYFHFFERKYSIIEFVKYEGIHYLSLIF